MRGIVMYPLYVLRFTFWCLCSVKHKTRNVISADHCYLLSLRFTFWCLCEVSMRAVLLVGHGSLRSGSGAAMIRLAARVRAAGVAPIAGAGFLNYSRPSFAEALARCAARGADEVVVQPYFLVPGKFVRVDLPRLLA